MALRTWIWVGVGVVLLLMIGCGALVGTGIYLASRQIDIARASELDADEDFAAVRRRFGDQEPVIDLDADPDTIRAKLEERARAYTGKLPSDLHILAWEEGEEHLVRLSLPFWLLRLSPSESIRLHSGDLTLEEFHVSALDLQRAGPCLLVDRREGRQRVLIWTE